MRLSLCPLTFTGGGQKEQIWQGGLELEIFEGVESIGSLAQLELYRTIGMVRE